MNRGLCWNVTFSEYMSPVRVRVSIKRAIFTEQTGTNRDDIKNTSRPEQSVSQYNYEEKIIKTITFNRFLYCIVYAGT